MNLERIFLEAGALRALVAEARGQTRLGPGHIREFRSRATILMEDLGIPERVLIDAIQHCMSGYPLCSEGIRRHAGLIARILCERANAVLRGTSVGMRVGLTYHDGSPATKGRVLALQGDALLIATNLNERRGTTTRQVVSAAHPNVRSVRIY